MVCRMSAPLTCLLSCTLLGLTAGSPARQPGSLHSDLLRMFESFQPEEAAEGQPEPGLDYQNYGPDSGVEAFQVP